MRKDGGYHAASRHAFSDERVPEVLKNPDAVYHSSTDSGNLISRRGEDVVIARGKGAGAGDVLTAHRPLGPHFLKR
ncbi:hypothetical protein JL475_27810 [Streptomyces sp. M2CJ-2]|uniref:hypothetical protein n=1 Tax=Streptomyces sp. M2CJ-2 TaxID=2803948 RepID=UPI0019297C5D|nr:hypothetical protein [Streptomyces sp. M2CJ-2]MBL3669720.1 hypothetical protein [Streptomyces sp. M2CJ-2]